LHRVPSPVHEKRIAATAVIRAAGGAWSVRARGAIAWVHQTVDGLDSFRAVFGAVVTTTVLGAAPTTSVGAQHTRHHKQAHEYGGCCFLHVAYRLLSVLRQWWRAAG